MSSENFPSEISEDTVVGWHAHIKTRRRVHVMMLGEAERENRSLSYVVSKIVERYYEEKKQIDVI